MPLDQAGRQSAAGAQTGLDAGHPPGIALVIIAKEVQQAMEREDSKLSAKRVPRLPRLRAGHADPDDDIAESAPLAGGKRENVGGTVFATELSVESADALIGDESDGHAAAGSCGGNGRQPACEARSAYTAARDDVDLQFTHWSASRPRTPRTP